jgi:hypothetical protein
LKIQCTDLLLLGGAIQSVALEFADVSGSNTGQHIAQKVKNIITTYGLNGKVIGIVVDNSKANDVALKEIAEGMNLNDKTFPTPEELHFRCFGHILNIGCQGKK